MLEAGLRVGEVVGVRPDDLNTTTCRFGVFPTRDGGQVYTSHMRQMVKRVARRAGVQEALRRSTG